MSLVHRTASLSLNPQKTAFLLCDIQERFRLLIHQMPSVIETASKMCAASKILDIPLIVTEQNPKALGHTLPELDIAHAALCVSKTKFSMLTPEILQKLVQLGTEDVVVFGIESHVCVTQTALSLLSHSSSSNKPFNVYILTDGISSINRAEVPVALARLSSVGCSITTSESLLFQLLGDAAHPKFKAISNLVKELKTQTAEALDILVAPMHFGSKI